MMRAAELNLQVGFSSEHNFIWDFWHVQDPAKTEGELDIFYLQASRLLPPDQRHNNASVGHAVLHADGTFKEIGSALRRGFMGSWDDLAIWTSTVEFSDADELFHMFYTGRGRRAPMAQKIGHAVSRDLRDWKRLSVHEPVLAAGAPYSTVMDKNSRGTFPIWRDPCLVYNPEQVRHELLVSARRNTPGPFNACIARAFSQDMESWTLTDPLIAPDHYDEMECPQYVEHDGKHYVLFQTRAKHYSPDWQREAGGAFTGLHGYVADSYDGEYRPVNGNGVILDGGDALFGARLLNKLPGTNEYRAAGWLDGEASGRFVGAISKVFRIAIEGERVEVSQ